MIRLALPKGRNLAPVVAALRGAGLDLAGLEDPDRRLLRRFPQEGVEVLLLKDWDLPLYVEQGVADLGFVGTDVLEESGADLLAPLQLATGRCRLSLVGPPAAAPAPGAQVRLATKYVRTARRWVAEQPWTAEIVALSGSVELGPVLGLADVALDVVQTGRTLAEHGLVELAPVAEVAPTLVANRAAWLRHRATLNE